MLDDDDESNDLNRALGMKLNSSSSMSFSTASSASASSGAAAKLSRVYQLTGFSDPVYVESHLQVADYDIVLDMLVVNQTGGILQNLQVELHTSGDLKVVERPQTFTIAPGGSQRIHSSIKLTSTESGVIFGNVVYDNASGTTKTIVVLNNIHMDVREHITAQRKESVNTARKQRTRMRNSLTDCFFALRFLCCCCCSLCSGDGLHRSRHLFRREFPFHVGRI